MLRIIDIDSLNIPVQENNEGISVASERETSPDQRDPVSPSIGCMDTPSTPSTAVSIAYRAYATPEHNVADPPPVEQLYADHRHYRRNVAPTPGGYEYYRSLL